MCTLMQVTDSYNTVFGEDKPCIIDGPVVTYNFPASQ